MTTTAWGALALTILIEAPVYALFAWLLGVGWRRWAIAVVGVNLVTHPVLYAVADSRLVTTVPALLAAEAVVVIVEALLLRWWWERRDTAGMEGIEGIEGIEGMVQVVLAALAANATSTAVGLLLS